jgi:hypothetical protein
MLVLCLWVASVMVGPLAYAGDPTLIAWWKLNDGSGTVALDSSGNGNNGTIMNPAQGLGAGGSVWVNDPERGMVISFNGADGSGAYVDTDVIIPAQTLQNAFTWIFWAKQPAAQATNNDTILGNRYGGVSSPLQFVKFTPTRFENYNDDGSYLNGINYTSIPSDVWVHHALVKDGASLTYYRNGVALLTNTATKTMAANPFYMGADGFSGAQENWQGYLSDVRLYERALTESEVKRVMGGAGPNSELAGEPTPENEATDVPRDVVLGWTAGEFAATHNVYLGTAFEDVNGATVADSRGVLASEGQADAAFDPEGLLEFGQTYYWRVDEVNAAPDNTVFKGETWSFTAEPYAYLLTAPQITATASNFQPGMGPENTINGSGLDEFDEHDAELPNMWMTTGGFPAWIQYEFDKAYKLDKMWVWNSNQVIESFLGFGAKSVTVEYSADGQTWATLEGATEFAKATATAGYAANTTVEFAGATAKFVKITIAGNWGGMAGQTGLSEVRFFYVPVQAFEPQPAEAATGVSVETELAWRPGREATSHTVTIGTDSDAVAAGSVAGAAADGHSYTPASLDVATTYYWKVDAVGDGGTQAGDVWSFTTQEFVAIDDFEDYNDDVDAQSTIWNTWVDGLTTKASGSQVGYDESPFAERTVIHGGKQAMPLIYDNTSSPYYSEAERTFDSPQDWTAHGADTLCLWFQGIGGDAGNSSEGLYVTVTDDSGKSKTVANADAAATVATAWQEWTIPYSEFTSAGVKMTAVKSIIVGVGNRAGPTAGGTGKVYIDDIGYGVPLP